MQTETHPFPPFVPENMQTLIVGSFPGRQQTQLANAGNEWFYGAPRNQFWKIIENVYEVKLKSVLEKKQLFSSQKIGMADIILKAKRQKPSNADQDLVIVAWNADALEQILRQHPAVKICCTGKFVETHFKKLFPLTGNIHCLPSPSPRYATMTLQEKIAAYKKMLPPLTPKNTQFAFPSS